MVLRRALFIGRFQPFHKGHACVVRRLLKKYDEVIVMVGSSESPLTRENPFSAGERIEMIRSALTKPELARIVIIPVRDVHDHSLWVPHVLSCVPGFESVYSNNQLVQKLFRDAGFSVYGIEFHKREHYTGDTIRKKIASGGEWEHCVPKNVAVLMKRCGIGKRLGKNK